MEEVTSQLVLAQNHQNFDLHSVFLQKGSNPLIFMQVCLWPQIWRPGSVVWYWSCNCTNSANKGNCFQLITGEIHCCLILLLLFKIHAGMRQVLGPGTLGRPRGIGWRGRWEGGSGWGIHVTPWLIHVNVWQNPLKCCEVISL